MEELCAFYMCSKTILQSLLELGGGWTSHALQKKVESHYSTTSLESLIVQLRVTVP